MFRKMLSLAVEAVKVEVDRWRNPRQPDGHLAWLDDARAAKACPFCRKAKPAGQAFCRQCLSGVQPKGSARAT